MYANHAETTGLVAAPADSVFLLIDDHARLSSHMARRTWRTGWGKMSVTVDSTRGRSIGAHIVLAGRMLGIPLFVEEVVTEYVASARKVWETVGQARLLVIGAYRMGFELAEERRMTKLRVFIDYDLPKSGIGRVLGRAFGEAYASWCTRRMVSDATRAFASRFAVR